MKLSDLFSPPFEHEQEAVNAIVIRDSGGDIVCSIMHDDRDCDERDVFVADKLVELLDNEWANEEEDQ